MKKKIAFIIVAAVALVATAGDFTSTVNQTTNSTNEFSMSKSSEGCDPMNVYSAMDLTYNNKVYHAKINNFFVECMITPGDMENVPVGAKVTSIACGGEKIPGRNGEVSADNLFLAAYIKNDVNPADDSYTSGGYTAAKASYAEDELYGPMTEISLTAPEGEEAQVIHSNFNPTKPFEYTGNIFKVGLDIFIPDSVFFSYNTTAAETEVSTTYHTVNYFIFSDVVFYYNCWLLVAAQMMGVDVGMYFEPNKLPAFTLNYYTNDVKGKVTGAGGELVLSGGEEPLTKTVAAGEEFAFENVDYTKIYTLTLNGEVVAEDLAFEDITKDIYVEIVASGDTPMVGDVDGDGTVTAADVTALYNWLLNNDASSLVNGDQDGDGVITSSDVTMVYNVLLGSK
ncbi:MAG: dockerin type I repeat-containing protein [Muribaculaceae bacterium]|nr:dockerin type I repeat-containing protein [Muribaculaceae bacterium]